MERMTSGTHQGHGSMQASASLFQARKMVPPNGFLTSGSHAIVNVINKRENCTQGAADTRDPAARPVIFVFETEAGCQLGCAGHSSLSSQPFLLCLPQDQPSSFFFFLKMASPVFLCFCRIPN